jgi:dihydroxy-acid dehydratase
MGCLAEAIGMTLPGSAATPAIYAQRLRIAEATGEAICRLVRRGIKARDIIGERSLENAVKVCIAIGGSTNAVLHLTALAYEAEARIDILEAFEKHGKAVPVIAKVNPASKWDMEDFYRAGGIPRVIERLRPLLNMDVMTCTGTSLEETIRAYRFAFPDRREVIRTLEDPFDTFGGIAVLRGNLAPNTGISKPAAIDPSVRRFTGKAIVFDSEEEANRAILDGTVREGHVVVIRYEGPKGGPGMREMYRALKYLYGLGLNRSTAVITDGRFSGTNAGCFVAHISPEAQEGGPIAIVKNGDTITIDVEAGIIHLHVEEGEIERRLKEWRRPEPKVREGYLSLYARLASSAHEGAIIKYR